VTLGNKRWAQLASELKFTQFDTARKQAEVWRAGLAALTWLAPAQATAKPLVQVTESTGRQSCGQLTGVSDRQLIIQPTAGPVLIPLSAVTALTPRNRLPLSHPGLV
jgi:hypothetical protein